VIDRLNAGIKRVLGPSGQHTGRAAALAQVAGTGHGAHAPGLRRARQTGQAHRSDHPL